VYHGYIECVRHSHERCERFSFHLSHDICAVDLIGDLADAEMRGGLFVEDATDDQRENLALTRR
jgi:hypothetical protein